MGLLSRGVRAWVQPQCCGGRGLAAVSRVRCCSFWLAWPAAPPSKAGLPPCTYINPQVVTTANMADYQRRYALEPLVKSAEQLQVGRVRTRLPCCRAPPSPLDRHLAHPTRPLQYEELLKNRVRATVDEPCPRCKNPVLEYYTMQLRSADEGQVRAATLCEGMQGEPSIPCCALPACCAVVAVYTYRASVACLPACMHACTL